MPSGSMGPSANLPTTPGVGGGKIFYSVVREDILFPVRMV